MLEILQNFVTTITTSTSVTSIVPAANIFTGPVDILSQQQNALVLPSIILSTVSESQRPVPQYARDTMVQLDIWSRNSQLEVENVYEAVITALNYLTYNQGTAHICWQLLGGSKDDFETDRRVWHKSVTFQVWAVKPH